MRLITLSKFRETYFETGSQPTTRTLRRWADDGDLAGVVRMGDRYYVDRDAWDADDDTLVERILSAHS